jgi:hypothetical protein
MSIFSLLREVKASENGELPSLLLDKLGRLWK